VSSAAARTTTLVNPHTHSLARSLAPAQIFHESIEYFRSMAAADDSVPDASAKADAFADAYAAAIASPKHYSCLHLCKLREDALRNAGFRDIFRVVKATENANALKLLKSVLDELDALDAPSSWPVVISNILAGNIFDCGTAATRNDSFCFQTSRTYLKSRPWVIDDLNTFQRAMTSKTYGLPARPSCARSLTHAPTHPHTRVVRSTGTAVPFFSATTAVRTSAWACCHLPDSCSDTTWRPKSSLRPTRRPVSTT